MMWHSSVDIGRHLRSGRTALGGASTALLMAVVAVLLLPFAAGVAAGQQRVMLDEAAIIVNNRIMTRREVAAIRELQIKELQARYKGDDLARQMKLLNASLTETLINNLVVESRADELGITVGDKEIDQRMETIVRRDPSVMDIYTEAQMKDYIYKDALRRQVLQREVNSRVRVDDEDIVRACRDETREGREVDVGHILIRGHDAAALAKIQDIRKQLMSGADFELTATTYSEDPSAATNHGRLGFISRGQFVKEFEDAAFSQPVGQVSQPVQTQFGYHLIKVFGERAKAGVNCDALDETNRNRIYNRLYNIAVEKRTNEFMEQARKKADIVVNLQ
jgi:parvulin-like peptidyl-prolyl isomerase